MSKSIEIGYVESNKAQYCSKCGAYISAHTLSVKITKRMRGRVSLTETRYVCLACESKPEVPQ